MSWLALVPVILAAIVILYAPGLVGGFIAGFRGVRLVALAAPMTMAVLTIAVLVLPLVHLAWTPLVAIPSMLGLAVAAGLLIRLFRRPAEHEPGASRFSLLVVLAGGLVASITVMHAVGHPGNFAQIFDNVFHLNAIRFAIDTGSASPLTLSQVSAPGSSGFYPSGWHALNALVVQLTGSSIPAAVNAVTIVVVAGVWSTGLLFLANTLFGENHSVAVAVALLVPVLVAFPMRLLYFGPLYPVMLATSLLPAVLALTLEQVLAPKRAGLSPVGAWLVIFGAAGGVAISHPGMLLTWVFAANLVLVSWVLLGWRRFSRKQRVVVSVATAAIILVSIVALYKLRPGDQSSVWGPYRSSLWLFAELFSGSILGGAISQVALVTTVVGLVVLWKQREALSGAPYLLVLYGGFGFLYFVAAVQEHGWPRELLTGPWYQDPNRLGIVMFVPLAMVCVAGLLYLWVRIHAMPSLTWRRVALAALVLFVVSGWFSPGVMRLTQYTNAVFEITDESKLISSDELALLERIDDEVPEDAVIAGNVWQGAGMAYALADRQVLARHLFYAYSADDLLILDELNLATPNSPVCEAIDRQNVQYVLDFPGPVVFGKGKEYVGLKNLAESSAVELVDSEGDASLYRVVACG